MRELRLVEKKSDLQSLKKKETAHLQKKKAKTIEKSDDPNQNVSS